MKAASGEGRSKSDLGRKGANSEERSSETSAICDLREIPRDFEISSYFAKTNVNNVWFCEKMPKNIVACFEQNYDNCASIKF